MSVRPMIKSFLRMLQGKIGGAAFSIIFGNFLSRESIIEFCDGILDFLEDYAETTETSVDDKIIRAIRDALDIPDKD